MINGKDFSEEEIVKLIEEIDEYGMRDLGFIGGFSKFPGLKMYIEESSPDFGYILVEHNGVEIGEAVMSRSVISKRYNSLMKDHWEEISEKYTRNRNEGLDIVNKLLESD